VRGKRQHHQQQPEMQAAPAAVTAHRPASTLTDEAVLVKWSLSLQPQHRCAHTHMCRLPKKPGGVWQPEVAAGVARAAVAGVPAAAQQPQPASGHPRAGGCMSVLTAATLHRVLAHPLHIPTAHTHTHSGSEPRDKPRLWLPHAAAARGGLQRYACCYNGLSQHTSCGSACVHHHLCEGLSWPLLLLLSTLLACHSLQ
jgi:hypothetical protein